MQGIAVAGEGADLQASILYLRLVLRRGGVAREQLVDGTVRLPGEVPGADLDHPAA